MDYPRLVGLLIVIVALHYTGCSDVVEDIVDFQIPDDDGFNIDNNYESYVYKGKKYVRVYQTVYATYIDPGDDENIFLNEMNMGDKKPNSNQKYSYQMHDGTVHSKPTTTKNMYGEIITRDNNWISIGFVERQLYHMGTYGEDERTHGAAATRPPSIQSFLIEFEVFREIQDWLVAEGAVQGRDLSKNVDIKSPNQIGLNEAFIDKMNEAIVPHSLVTYILEFDQRHSYPRHLGAVRPLVQLADVYLPRYISDIFKNQDLNSRFDKTLYKLTGQILIYNSLFLNVQTKEKENLYSNQNKQNLDTLSRELKSKLPHSTGIVNDFINLMKQLNKITIDKKRNLNIVEFPKRFPEPQSIDNDKMFRQSGEDCVACYSKSMHAEVFDNSLALLEENKGRVVKCKHLYMQVKAFDNGVKGIARMSLGIRVVIIDENTRQNLINIMNRLILGIDLDIDDINESYERRLIEFKTQIENGVKTTLEKRKQTKDTVNKVLRFLNACLSSEFQNKRRFIIFASNLLNYDIGDMTIGDEALIFKSNQLETSDGNLAIRPLDIDTTISISSSIDVKQIPPILRNHFLGSQLRTIEIVMQKVPSQIDSENLQYDSIHLVGKLRSYDKNNKNTQTINMKSILVKDIQYVADNTKIFTYNSIKDTYLKTKTSKTYDKEIIISITNDKDKSVEKAAGFLQKRYKTDQHFNWNGEKLINEGKSTNPVYIDKNTRVTIVGHGEITQNSILALGGLKATDIASLLSNELGTDSKAPKEIGKISVVCCNSAPNPSDNKAIAKDFGSTLFKELSDRGAHAKISVRSTYLQVDEQGRKIYGILNNEGGIDWIKDVSEKLVIDEHGREHFTSRHRNNEVGGETSGPLAEDATKPKQAVCVMDFGDIQHFVFTDVGLIDEKIRPGLDMEHSYRHIQAADEEGIHVSLVQLEYNLLTDKLYTAMADITDNFGPQWLPLLESAESQNGKTSITLYNTEDATYKTVFMSDNAISEIKSSLETESHRSVKPRFSGKVGQRVSLASSIHMSLFGFSTFIYASVAQGKYKNKMCNPSEENCEFDPNINKMIKALEVQAYIGLADGAVGVTSDILEYTDMGIQYKYTKSSLGIKTASKHLKRFSKVAKGFGKAAMGIGAAASMISLGFSSYQLAHATTKEEKIEGGIQVAVDSISVVTSSVFIGTAIATSVSSSIASGVGTAGAFCSAVGGPVGAVVGAVIAVVGFLLSTTVSLVFEFKATAKQAEAIGMYLYDLSETYKYGGLEYTDDFQTLSFNQYTIVDEVDLESGWVTLGSEYLYRTEYGSWGKRTLIIDKQTAINILRKLGNSNTVQIRNKDRIQTLILPSAAKCYLRYGWQRLPFCNLRRSKGFKLMKKLKAEDEFDYCFYRFPNQNVINNMEPEYQYTSISITLLPTVQTVLVPRLPSVLQGYFQYRITSRGGSHYIALADGVKVDLSLSSSDTQWHFLTQYVTHDGIILPSKSNNSVTIGNTTIHLGPSFTKSIFFHCKKGIRIRFDVHTYTYEPVSVLFDSSISVTNLQRHLSLVSNVNIMPFVLIDNFSYSDQYIGRAWYDVKNDRFLYTKMHGTRVTNDFKNSVRMLHASDTHIYYSGKQGKEQVVWSTDRQTQEIQSSYQFFCGNERYNITIEGVQENYLMMAQKIKSVTFIYGVLPTKITLISISGSRDDVRKIAGECIPTLNKFLPQAQRSGFRFPGTCVYPDVIYLLPLVEHEGDYIYHYWIYTNVTDPPNQSQNDVFCALSNAPIVTGVIDPKIDDQCNDLSLLDILRSRNQSDIRFYACYENKRMFVQVNDDASQEILVEEGITKVHNYGQQMIIHSRRGLVYQPFNDYPYLKLVGVDQTFFSLNTNWSHEIEHVLDTESYSGNILLLMGLENGEKQQFHAWFDTENDVFIIDSFNKTDTIYKGPSGNPRYVWLYSTAEKMIMLQRVVDVLDSEGSNGNTTREAPFAQIYHTEVERADNIHGIMNIQSSNGTLLSIDHFNNSKLLGVKGFWARYGDIGFLAQLCIDYYSKDIISLGVSGVDNETDVFSWYHCQLSRPYNLTMPKGKPSPTFLGVDNNKLSLFFLVADTIVEVYDSDLDSGRVRRSNNDTHYTHYSTQLKRHHVGDAFVMGHTFSIHVADNGILSNIPMLNDYTSLVISGGAERASVHISGEVWLHYETIVFTSISTEAPASFTLNVSAPLPYQYPWQLQGDDTVYEDQSSTTRILMLMDFLPAPNENPETQPLHILTVYMCNDIARTYVSNRIKERHQYDYRYILVIKSCTICGITIVVMAYFCQLMGYSHNKRRKCTNSSPHMQKTAKQPRSDAETGELSIAMTQVEGVGTPQKHCSPNQALMLPES